MGWLARVVLKRVKILEVVWGGGKGYGELWTLTFDLQLLGGGEGVGQNGTRCPSGCGVEDTMGEEDVYGRGKKGQPRARDLIASGL